MKDRKLSQRGRVTVLTVLFLCTWTDTYIHADTEQQLGSPHEIPTCATSAILKATMRM